MIIQVLCFVHIHENIIYKNKKFRITCIRKRKINSCLIRSLQYGPIKFNMGRYEMPDTNSAKSTNLDNGKLGSLATSARYPQPSTQRHLIISLAFLSLQACLGSFACRRTCMRSLQLSPFLHSLSSFKSSFGPCCLLFEFFYSFQPVSKSQLF